MVGYAYGYGFIISTRNGGATWASETPAGLNTYNQGALTGSQVVSALAVVPTTY